MEIARGVGTPLQLDKATKEREFGFFARVLVDVDLAGDGFVIENVHNTHLVAGNISMNVSAGHANEVDEDDEDYDDIDDSSVEEIYEDGSGHNNHSLERTYNSPQSQSWHDTVVEDQFNNQTEVSTGAVPPGFEHVGVLAKDVSLITSHVEKGVLVEDDFVKALSKSQKKKHKQQAKHVVAAAASEGPYPKRDRKKKSKVCIMNVLYWNIRGVGNSDFQSELLNICRTQKPDLVCISEPMVAFDSISSAFWFALNLDFVTVNDRGSRLPNLWLLRGCHVPSPVIISNMEQQVTIQVSFDNELSQFSFVYASTSYIKRRDLWHDF
ncbi:hypothetical protein ACLB2K_035940 [Fragaria x ananassa]